MVDRTCNACGKVFRWPCILAYHERRKTPCAPVAPDPNKPHSCLQCGRAMARRQTLRIHWKTCRTRLSAQRVPFFRNYDNPSINHIVLTSADILRRRPIGHLIEIVYFHKDAPCNHVLRLIGDTRLKVRLHEQWQVVDGEKDPMFLRLLENVHKNVVLVAMRLTQSAQADVLAWVKDLEWALWDEMDTLRILRRHKATAKKTHNLHEDLGDF